MDFVFQSARSSIEETLIDAAAAVNLLQLDAVDAVVFSWRCRRNYFD